MHCVGEAVHSRLRHSPGAVEEGVVGGAAHRHLVVETSVFHNHPGLGEGERWGDCHGDLTSFERPVRWVSA
jgi:hypothetical protein